MSPDRDMRRANAILIGLAALHFLVEWVPGISGPYGFFIDEFYYLACADHLAFGYVDHPPLSIVLLWLIRAAIGDSLAALRVVPALAGAATVLLTGFMARRLGAGAWGQGLAAGAVAAAGILQVMFSFYSMNALSALMWTICFWILIEIERRDEPRLWLVVGALAGLEMQNKHTFVLLLLGLAAGMILTRARRHLASRWLWLGLAVMLGILLPNVLWQAAHGWPSIEFYRNADLYKNVPTPPLEVLWQQVLFMNPATLPVWLAGLIFFLFLPGGRSLRHLGWIFVILLALMLVGQKSRPDRIASAYTALFAGGGLVLEELARRRGFAWLRLALPAALVIGGGALAPLGLPLLSPRLTGAYAAALGITPQIESGEGKRTPIPQWLADRLGWEELVADVVAVAAEIDPAERDRAIILAPSYGQGGAIERLGRGRGLPPVYALQNSYSEWGPPPDPVPVAIIIGLEESTVRQLYREVRMARIHDCDGCMPWRDEVPIWLARGPRVTFKEAWPHLIHYE